MLFLIFSALEPLFYSLFRPSVLKSLILSVDTDMVEVNERDKIYMARRIVIDSNAI